LIIEQNSTDYFVVDFMRVMRFYAIFRPEKSTSNCTIKKINNYYYKRDIYEQSYIKNLIYIMK